MVSYAIATEPWAPSLPSGLRLQSTPRPAAVQCAPEARDWATFLCRGVDPAPTVFMVMACLATQCLYT